MPLRHWLNLNYAKDQIELILARFFARLATKKFGNQSEEKCIICQEPIEYESPAPLCQYDWTAWWHGNPEANRYVEAYSKFKMRK